MRRLHLYLLALFLSVIGLGLFAYRALVLRFPLFPEDKSFIWNVEAQISFVARDKPVKVAILIPRNTRRFTIADERFISRGYGLTTTTEDDNRQAVWTIRQSKGQQTLFYQAVVRRVDGRELEAPTPPPIIESPRFEGPYLAAAESLMAEIRAQSADVESLVAELIKRLNKPQPDDIVALLLGKEPSQTARIQVAVGLLAHSKIPARVVHGVRLEEQNRDAPLIRWLEVHDQGRWQPFDPATGEARIPEDYLAWWRGRSPMARLQGVDTLLIRLAVSRTQETALGAVLGRGQIKRSPLLEFSLFSLPIRTQAVYRILLMIPIGAFLVVIFRNVVGINTFGTFMPVLIALAFRETQLLWGIILFSAIVAMGLGVRFYLDQLKLLLVPRLASVLIVVVILMAVMSVLTHKLGLERGLSVGLFPMVIMTMTIERMSIVWEERGPGEAMKQGLGSLMVASLAYLLMTNSYAQHLVFVFPEILLVLLACTLLLGRYSGYRLMELRRFKALAGGAS